jgi:hypothetical protein
METAIEFTIDNTIRIGLFFLLFFVLTMCVWAGTIIKVIVTNGNSSTNVFSSYLTLVLILCFWFFSFCTTFTFSWLSVGILLNIIEYFTK